MSIIACSIFVLNLRYPSNICTDSPILIESVQSSPKDTDEWTDLLWRSRAISELVGFSPGPGTKGQRLFLLSCVLLRSSNYYVGCRYTNVWTDPFALIWEEFKRQMHVSGSRDFCLSDLIWSPTRKVLLSIQRIRNIKPFRSCWLPRYSQPQ